MAHGAFAATMDGTDGNSVLWNGISNIDHYGRAYLYALSNPGAEVNLVKFDEGISTKGYISVVSGGQVKLKDNLAGNSQLSTATIPLNTWVRFEWHMIVSATVGQLQVKFFTEDSTTPIETITTPANWDLGAVTNEIRFLDLDNTWGNALWIDDIVANASTWPGPAQSVLTANFNLGVDGVEIQTTDPGDVSPWDVIRRNDSITYDSTHALGALSADRKSVV